MKISKVIAKLKELSEEQFRQAKLHTPMGNVPDEAEVEIEYWDKEGFHGMTKDFDVTININGNIEISPNG